VIALAFAIGSGLAAVAGLLFAVQAGQINPYMGFTPVLKAFIAAVIGGFGSIPGAVVGGYVLGALEYAKRSGAATVGITSNPRTPITRLAGISIVTPTGPEAITGSTRMKAGTAQKMVLNMLSTAVMIRLGRVHDNWMIGVALTNHKLRARGLRILMDASGATVADATRALRQSGHNMDAAFIILKTGASAQEAKRLLRDTHGNVHNALTRTRQTSRGATQTHG